MFDPRRPLLYASSLLVLAICSPLQTPFVLDRSAQDAFPAQRNSGPRGRFLHLTDMHPDPYYRVDSAESTACHRNKPRGEKERGGHFGLPYGDCDSPFALTNFTFDFLDKHWTKEIDFVIWTGDSARHDNDPDIPRTLDEIYDLNRAMARRMNEVFTSRGIPVIPSLGNNDVSRPNDILKEYASIWRTFIPSESHQVFKRGGYFSVEVIPNQIAVISMNTMYFYDSNKAVGGCAYTKADDPGNVHFDWLEDQLDLYRERGMQVWLSGHVPPSPGNYFPGCFVRYADIVLRYQDTILGQLFGHMNVDHFFFLHSDDTVLPDEESTELWTKRSNFALRRDGSENNDIEESKHISLAETLMEEFSMLPKEKKADLDDFSIINVAPSVVPNPYLPSFRVFAYNITGAEEDDALEELKKKKKKDKKKKAPKRDHGHKHPGKEGEVDCKQKENRDTWACRPKKPQHASADAPSRTNRLWTPLGYAQYWLPKMDRANESTRPKYKLEYTTFKPSSLHPASGAYPIPLKELPKSLRGGGETGAETGEIGKKKKTKETPYGLADLTVGSWLGLARELGDGKKAHEKVRARFRKYMYQGAEEEE
ncbi:hypothetical protein M0805_007398 [Coniferiporia weirii]|nr:hypothetical protein M0805_007398 [Coniferiporia weirii]